MGIENSIKYPIYIVSKGRGDNQKTAKIFMAENIPFHVVVEPQEVVSYTKSVPRENILELPFSNLGLGSYPARNWCWEHSLSNGFDKHFLFDDNIMDFCRLNNGKRTQKAAPKEALVCLQTLHDRFFNVAISGFNYRYFVTSQTKKPFGINSHVYSGMLINNKIGYRWRLKYNEDVDLCLQVLNGGLCTILLNAFLINKTSTTVKQPGGNQAELYLNNDVRKKELKSCSLHEIWPQYVKLTHRFGRPHHQVSWHKHFKQPLKRIENQI